MAVRTSRKYRVKEWLSAVKSLASEVEGWAEKEHWSVEKSDADVSDSGPKASQDVVPVLTIYPSKNHERIILEPKSHDVIGSQGRVDLYAYPSLYRVKLLYKPQEQPETEWVVRTDSGIDWPEAWSRATFVHLVEGLLRAK